MIHKNNEIQEVREMVKYNLEKLDDIIENIEVSYCEIN